jgi:hypothetical protein
MLGRESAIDNASAEASGGRIALVESEGSNTVDIVSNLQEFNGRFLVICGNAFARDGEAGLVVGREWVLLYLVATTTRDDISQKYFPYNFKIKKVNYQNSN